MKGNKGMKEMECNAQSTEKARTITNEGIADDLHEKPLRSKQK